MNTPTLVALSLVAIGGAVGAVTRYLVDLAVSRRVPGDRPWGILAVNIAGSFLLGLVVPVASEPVTLLLGVGLCGALTTYSTVAANVWGLIEEGRVKDAAVVLVVTVVASVSAAGAGLALATPA